MNIGIFTDSYHPEVSGVVTTVRIIERELLKNGHKVYIFTTTHPDADKNKDNIFRLPSIPYVFYPQRRLGIFYSRKIIKIIKELDLDIIHSHTEFSLGIFAKIVAKKFNIPIVHSYQSMYNNLIPYISKSKCTGLINKILKAYSKWFCNTCNLVIVPTTRVYNLLKSYEVAKPIQIIPTGIDLNPLFKKNHNTSDTIELRKQLGISVKDKVILYIGRISVEKRINLILEKVPFLIEKLPQLKVLIIGEGPEVKNLMEISSKLNIEKYVIFAGEKPWDEIGKYYMLGDVFVSASAAEAQGLTFIEAMAAHVPVVAKNEKNIEYLIRDNYTGRIFTTDDELDQIILDTITNTSKKDQITKNAYEKVFQFSSEHFIKEIETVFSDILGKSNQDKHKNL